MDVVAAGACKSKAAAWKKNKYTTLLGVWNLHIWVLKTGVGPLLTAFCSDFMMKIKMILIKKRNQQQRWLLKDLNATKTARFLMPRMLEGEGGMQPVPPRGKGPCGPFSGHSCLLHLQWPTRKEEHDDSLLVGWLLYFFYRGFTKISYTLHN